MTSRDDASNHHQLLCDSQFDIDRVGPREVIARSASLHRHSRGGISMVPEVVLDTRM
jgi:hypothetical protein